MSYLLVKYLHIVSTAAAFALFFIRGIWAIRAYPRPQEIWVRLLPHAVDGILIVTAIVLALLANRVIWDDHWMAAKIGLLLVYATLSVVALNLARRTVVIVFAWIVAMMAYLFMTSIAVLKNPLGVLILL